MSAVQSRTVFRTNEHFDGKIHDSLHSGEVRPAHLDRCSRLFNAIERDSNRESHLRASSTRTGKDFLDLAYSYLTSMHKRRRI